MSIIRMGRGWKPKVRKTGLWFYRHITRSQICFKKRKDPFSSDF